MITITQQHLDDFSRDGFVAVEGALNPDEIRAAQARFEPMFSGTFETGLYPDEWNWRLGRDREDLTRQICNGWKSDLTIASIVLRADIGEACARLHGWPAPASARTMSSGSRQAASRSVSIRMIPIMAGSFQPR